MLFSTPFFLFGFLPLFFAIYWLLPWRRSVLIFGSAIFYGWNEPRFLWIVLASACLDWKLGRLIFNEGPRRRTWVAVGVTANLAILVYTKYAGFGIENINTALALFGWKGLDVPRMALPLGVSFIVFEKITYLVDLYRRVAAPADSLLNYLNYVLLFPKLLAGPIVKYHDIASQLARPVSRYEDIRDGMARTLGGLGKKVLLADMLAPTADAVFQLPPAALDPGTAWLGLLCFTLQIYFDFSGYSDMAIGMARMLGFRLLENFHTPYLATSFTDFWRRWHISLSSWIKEYLYIPLGGNRVSKTRSYLNLCICFLLSGLWHGASWNFVIWGCLHGVALVFDRAFWLEWQKRLPRLINMGLTFLLVANSWVFFRCQSFGQACHYLAALAGAPASQANAVFLQRDVLAALLAATGCVIAPLLGWPRWDDLRPALRIPALACGAVLLVACAGRISVSDFHPFLYFRF